MSEPLTPNEEAALRRRVRLARCAWTYVAIDGRPLECGQTLGYWHEGEGGDTHEFVWRDSPTTDVARLLATLDAARAGVPAEPHDPDCEACRGGFAFRPGFGHYVPAEPGDLAAALREALDAAWKAGLIRGGAVSDAALDFIAAALAPTDPNLQETPDAG